MKNSPFLLILILLVSCNGARLDRVFKGASPYENYVNELSSSPLQNSSLVQSWISAGELALLDSSLVSLPYQELGYFDPKDPKAFFLRFPVQEGQQLNITLNPISEPDANFFIDLYDIRPDGSMSRKTSAEVNNSITENIRRDGIHALRVQPEILRGGVFELKINYEGSLAFPIPEKTSLNVSSFFGDPREGGKRRHEGVDVFAQRGTPVVAVDDGRVSRVGNNRLGGKTVSILAGGYSYYYAHLDSQLVNMGQQVKAGDTLGLVGNTGNAITTAPHLHFGIYGMGRRSVDPINFFRDGPTLPTQDLADSISVGNLARVKGNLANIRQAPNTESPILTQLSEKTVLTVEGRSGDWYRIRLPQLQQGFIAASLVEAAEKPLDMITLTAEDQFKSSWYQPVYQSEFEIGEAELLGEFNTYNLVRSSGGRLIWHKPALIIEVVE